MRQNWKLLAFLGRYAHQQIDVLLGMTVRDLTAMAEATGALIESEYQGHEGSSGGGG